MKTETRRTDWIEYGHYGLTHYRIWKQFDGLRWFQRHEWKQFDGSTDLEPWIVGSQGWAPKAEPVEADQPSSSEPLPRPGIMSLGAVERYRAAEGAW